MNALSAIAGVKLIAARLAETGRGRTLDDEHAEEVRVHVAQETEYNMQRGMSPEEARRVALASFGGVRRYREEVSESRGFIVLDNVMRDLRLAVRRLRRAPTFAAGVIATMAIGVASAIGIGTLVVDVLLHPLPYANPATLARVLVITPGLSTKSTESSPGPFVYFREQAHSFTSLGSYYMNDGMTISDSAGPEQATAAMVSPSVFEMLGVRPSMGRLFRDEDARAPVAPVIISYGLWTRRFGRDAGVVGKTIEVNRSRRVIVGVLPKGFDFPSPAVGIWYPSQISAQRASLNYRYFNIIGRLRPGVTAREAEAELRTLIPRLSTRFPETSAEAVRASGLTASVQTLKDATVGPVRTELTLLGIMVAVVLLITTANVTTLFLLRAERLQGEVAVSKALGASRTAINRRFLSEGLVVGVASGVAALPLVALMLLAKFGFVAAQMPRLHEVVLTRGVVAALWLVVVIIGSLLGMVAAARAAGGAGGAIGAKARGGGRATGDRGWQRVQRGLVVTQVASALTLLLGAALMGQSLWRLSRVDIGFSTSRALTFKIVLPFQPYSRYQTTAAFHLSVIDALAGLPNVRAATGAMSLPFDREPAELLRQVVAEGERGSREATARPNAVRSNYFQAMGIPLRAGRSFVPGDMAAASPAVIVSASLARELFAGASPIGHEIRIADPMNYPPYRVVGVVGDLYGDRISDGVVKMLYFPLLAESPAGPIGPAAPYKPPIPLNPTGMHFIVDADAPMSALLPAIRKIVRDADPKVPVTDVTPMAAITAGATAQTRLMMVLLSTAAAAALLLSAIGLYSVIAYAVAGRRREFGIRLALGATPDAIVALVLRGGVLLVGVGVALGIAASLAASRTIRGVLFEVSATNPIIYVAGTIVIVLVAVAATYLPARNASRTDPAQTLRTE